ncbi:MAG: exonuclease SbcCD subunit D [Anaerolineales bacterium]|nr:exonuclease SbcCD subunit D [Anaerolineales bacterium]
MKILHFADAHIDMANTGRQDPDTGLPIRVMDYLRSLDEIVDTAIREKVDLVLFAGDAYKDRNPAPTFMREWGRRMIKLSKARIPTVLLVGNHDLSPSLGRAHALEEYATLEVPYIKVLDQPQFLGPADLWDLPLQIIALPWITRSGMLAFLASQGEAAGDIYEQMAERLSALVTGYLEDDADHSLPVVMAAHASVQGAVYGGEHTVMLGNDLVLSGSLVKDKRLDYVALGHIHKKQNLNEGGQPPVVYPGSIERIDFGEARDDKFFVIADVNKGNTQLDWRQLRNIRKFWTGSVTPENELNVTSEIIAELPSAAEMQDAIVRLVVYYPREWELFIDEARIRGAAANAFEFHLIKRPQVGLRSRIAEGRVVSEMTPYDLLDIYWDTIQLSDEASRSTLTQLARDIIETPLQDES